MKITFYSNFLNHHQLPFCQEMCRIIGDGFTFVATEPIPKERLELGYADMNEQYDFCVCSYKNRAEYEKALSLGINSDIVIIGSAPSIFIKERLKRNKLTFRYNERIFKKGRYRLLNPKTLISLMLNHSRNFNKELYMLCASAYTAGDFALVGAYLGKTYKWGYFPQNIEYDINDLMQKKNNKQLELLWCGRFIDWKHPELALKVAKKLKKDGYRFSLKLIGTGEMDNELRDYCKNNQLEDCVEFLGSMSPERVREYMEKANIYLFTSDYNEGWGAVLNEAMNSGCAVVASHAIGSVPFMLDNMENGLIYKNGRFDELYEKVKMLMNDEGLRLKLSRNAVETIATLWNPKVAAERLIEFSEGLLNGKIVEFKDGPCSRAKFFL